MTTTFNLTNDELVKAGMRKLAVLGDGQEPSATQLTNGKQALNVMLKSFQTKGMPLWAVAEQDITLTATRSYTISVDAPLKVLQAILVDSTGGNIPMNLKTHSDYNLLTGNAATGAPVNYWHEPLRTTSVLHVWPTPDTYSISNRVVRLTYQRPFNDMVGATDTLDFPTYWLEAVIYGLAHRLSAEYGIPLQDRSLIAKEAEYFLQEALSFGTEEGSLYLQPDWTTR